MYANKQFAYRNLSSHSLSVSGKPCKKNKTNDAKESLQDKKIKTISGKKQIYNQTLTKVDFYGGFIYPEIEEQRQLRKKRTMTYIVSGKFKNNPFLMVDCAGIRDGENGLKTYHFRNKLKKLVSTENETYFCLTGLELYQSAIEAFDEKCYWGGENFDFKNTEHIVEILELFKLICESPNYSKLNIEKFCRLYFINKDNVYYYCIDDCGRLTYSQESTHLYKIPNGCFIDPTYADNCPIDIKSDFRNTEEIVEFCKNEILSLNAYNGLDLKDKFSYIVFGDNEKLINNSLKTNDEIVLSMIGGDYNQI